MNGNIQVAVIPREKNLYVYLKDFTDFFNTDLAIIIIIIIFSIWFFFHEHSRITGLQGKGKGISITPHYHFHPLHRHLDICRAITAESSPLHIASNRTQTENFWFPSASRLTTKLRTLWLFVSIQEGANLRFFIKPPTHDQKCPSSNLKMTKMGFSPPDKYISRPILADSCWRRNGKASLVYQESKWKKYWKHILCECKRSKKVKSSEFWEYSTTISTKHEK